MYSLSDPAFLEYTRKKFLQEVYSCYPGHGGNYPCDNGYYCDLCQSDKAQELWIEYRDKALRLRKMHLVK